MSRGTVAKPSPDQARASSVFLRRMVVAMAVFFGLGTVLTYGVSLLATPDARAELGAIPYPLFWFEFFMGWAYLGTAYGMGGRRGWALSAAWGIAVVHSFSATALWLWFFSGHAVEMGTLVMELLREGFWVLIGLYLYRAGR